MGITNADPNDLDWLIEKVHYGAVGAGHGWRYYVTVTGDGPPVDCDDQYYLLEARGLVEATADGVKLTRAGRRYRDSVAQRRAAARAGRKADVVPIRQPAYATRAA